MHRYVYAFLLLAVVAGCADLTNVPPPPIALSVLEGPIEGAVSDDLTGSSAHNVRLMRAVPADVLFAIHLPDIAGSIDRFKETGLYKWFTSKEVKEQFGEGAELWAKFELPPIGGPGGTTDPARLMKALQGELVIALEDINIDAAGPIPEVRALAGVTVTGAEHEAEQLLQFVDMIAAAQEGMHVEKGTVGGHGYSRIVGKKPMPWVVELALYDDALLAGFGRETVTAAMERLESQGQSLADNAAYLKAMTRCGDPRDAMRIHLNLEQVQKRYGAKLPAEARRMISVLGLDHLRSAVAAVRFEGTDIGISTMLDSPGGKDCITQLLGSHTVDRQFLARMPADTSSFSLFAIDGPKIIQTIRTALPDEMRKELEEGLADLRKQGFDLETDVFEVFGPRCALLNVPTERIDDGPGLEAIWNHVLGTALILEVHDPARAQELLARLPDRSPTSRRREFNIDGIMAHSYEFATDELPSDFAISYAITGGYLVLAPTERTLRRVLRPRSPETEKRFRTLLDEVPEGAVVASYDDMRKGPGIYLDAMLKSMASTMGGVAPDARRRRSRDSLLSRMGPSISYTVADQDGVFSFTRSPTGGFGSIGGISGIAMIAAIAVPNLHQARVSANESSAVATMRAIYTAQETFRANNLRDADADGDGEFGYLAELLGDRRPGDKRLLSPNPLVTGTFIREGREFTRSGYYFRVYLPAEDGSPVGEHEPVDRIREVDGDLAEAVMTVVAWPANKGMSGLRAFHLDGQGRLFACSDGPYTKKNAPSPDVLCSQKGNLASQAVREGQRTRDGCTWNRVR